MGGAPDRTKLRVDPIGAPAGVRQRMGIHQGGEAAFQRIDHGDLVGLVGCHHEVALGRIPAAVMEEQFSLDHLDQRVDRAGVIH